MTNPDQARIEYVRPGKGVTEYVEDIVFENEQYLKTFKFFSGAVSERLTQNLRNNGFIANEQRTACVTKIYFFHEYFNLLQFQDEDHETLGYYSDVGTPLIKSSNDYHMTDWFLDIWLSPDGTLFELDMDEFEEALSQNLMTPTEAEIARITFKRLIDEVKQGIYPGAYLR